MITVKTTDKLLALRNDEGMIEVEDDLRIECDVPRSVGKNIAGISVTGNLDCSSDLYCNGDLYCDGYLNCRGDLNCSNNLICGDYLSCKGSLHYGYLNCDSYIQQANQEDNQ